MKNGLYHREIGMPIGALAPFDRTFSLCYGGHARREAFADRYGRIELPRQITVTPAQVVEVLVENGQPVKAVVRMPLDSRRDICLVIVPENPYEAFVKTVWVNLRNDAHRTLNRSKYNRP